MLSGWATTAAGAGGRGCSLIAHPQTIANSSANAVAKGSKAFINHPWRGLWSILLTPFPPLLASRGLDAIAAILIRSTNKDESYCGLADYDHDHEYKVPDTVPGGAPASGYYWYEQ
jgi:hypothetical protein